MGDGLKKVVEGVRKGRGAWTFALRGNTVNGGVDTLATGEQMGRTVR